MNAIKLLQPRLFPNPSSLASVVVVRYTLHAGSVTLDGKPTSFLTIHEVRKKPKLTQAGMTLGKQGLIYMYND